MKVRVETLFHGKVAVRDKFIKACKATGEPLVILHGHDEMYIPNSEIDQTITGKSKQPVKDQFSKDWHYLVYFSWKPMAIQKAMEI
jgi:hypothetical protein|tara:strand:- start:1581 stop:1838 length:258 start_codon:yes stop_codon:yes gene_type:complete